MDQTRRRALWFLCACGLCACGLPAASDLTDAQALTPAPSAAAQKLIDAARRQIGVTLQYDPAYSQLTFPNGDVPRERGVCTDVLIRAYRDAFALDLQMLINRDMRADFAAYPHKWGLTRPDANIDHRRVLNLQVFFRHKGAELALGEAALFEPGDLVSMTLPGNLPHIGIVSDRLDDAGRRVFIHNIGQGAREEAVLGLYPLTGRYRWLPAA